MYATCPKSRQILIANDDPMLQFPFPIFPKIGAAKGGSLCKPLIQLFSFRMMRSHSQVECLACKRRAESRLDLARLATVGVELKSGGTGPPELDGLLPSDPKRGPDLPPFRHLAPDLLSLATPL